MTYIQKIAIVTSNWQSSISFLIINEKLANIQHSSHIIFINKVTKEYKKYFANEEHHGQINLTLGPGGPTSPFFPLGPLDKNKILSEK